MNNLVVTAAAALVIHTVVMLAFRHLYLRLIPAAFDRMMGPTPPPDLDAYILAAYTKFSLKALVVFVLLPFVVGMFLCLALLSDWKDVNGQLLLLPHWLHLLSDKRTLGFIRMARMAFKA